MIGERQAAAPRRRTRSQMVFGVLGVVLCLVLGIAIALGLTRTGTFDAVIEPSAVIMSVGFSIAIGVFLRGTS